MCGDITAQTHWFRCDLCTQVFTKEVSEVVYSIHYSKHYTRIHYINTACATETCVQKKIIEN